MTTTPDRSGLGNGLIEALHVDRPDLIHADKLMLFGRFVGSWRLS